MIGGQLWGTFPQKLYFLLYLPQTLDCLSLKDVLPLDNHLVLEHFLLFTNVAPLSGQVPGIHCLISAGAQALVAPALIRSLQFLHANPKVLHFHVKFFITLSHNRFKGTKNCILAHPLAQRIRGHSWQPHH